MNLHDYDLIVINSSGGKDSLCAIYETCRLADEQLYPKWKIHVSHQDLGRMEWEGTKELAKLQADHFGLNFIVSIRRDKNGKEETLLEYVRRRKMWPSSQQRWCTSDYKRGPGARVVTQLTKGMKGIKVLYIFGFRKDESPARKKKEALKVNKQLTTKLPKKGLRQREVHEWLPIHGWSTKRVWETIKEHGLPYHMAYKKGMPRLSCVFCIFSPFDALVIAGIANYELLCEYVEVEDEIGHTFKADLSVREVKEAIDKGYKPVNVADWVM